MLLFEVRQTISKSKNRVIIMSIQSSKKLFSPLKVGDITLNHRIVMPPISRLRANWPNAIPSNMMLEHYSQRATEGGLIIAEATAVSAEARAYHTAPGLYTDEQVLGWKRITDVVHEKKGVIFVQLSHAGRATNALLTEGKLPITASVNQEFLQNKNIVVSTPNGFELPSEHRALQTNEIPNVIEQFRYAAENAKNAGFDGIEIQAGQGHIIEQFLQNKSNNRIDEYGGSIENRVRLLTEILESTISVWGQNRVGVRISPSSTFNGMGDSDPRALFRYLASRMNNYALAYLHIIEPRISGADTIAENQDAIATKELRGIYEGIIISAGGFTPATAENAIDNEIADLIAFGRHFTSNPDLPNRIFHDLPLTHYDRNTFYAFDANGYTDFSVYDFSKGNQKASVEV